MTDELWHSDIAYALVVFKQDAERLIGSRLDGFESSMLGPWFQLEALCHLPMDKRGVPIFRVALQDG